MAVHVLLLLPGAGLARAFTVLTCACFLPDGKHCVTDHVFYSVLPTKRQILDSMIALIYTLMPFSLAYFTSLCNFVALFLPLPFEFFFMP